MIPVSPVLPSGIYKEMEVLVAKDQPQYRPLPVLPVDSAQGAVLSRWQLTWRERFFMLFHGYLYLRMLTFHHPLQPVLPSTKHYVQLPGVK